MAGGRLRSALAVLAAVLLGAGCAKEGMPPGGPVDDEAPFVVSTFPESGATRVPAGQPIVFRFSEEMDERSVESALFFTPDIGPTLRVAWRGQELRLVPRVSLRENTTFVVTLSADASDLRRNKLEGSVTLAFSTGPEVDDASLAGTVYNRDEPVPRAWVWIYPVDDAGMSDLADPALASTDPPVSIPLYITQADTRGEFLVSHMARGTYRVFAYQEVDNRQGYGPDRDLLAVPTMDIPLESRSSRYEQLNISVAPRDTIGPSLRSAASPNLDWLNLRFSESLAPGTLPRILVEAVPLSEGAPPPSGPVVVVAGYVPAAAPATVSVQVTGLAPGARYRVRLLEARDALGNSSPPDAPPAAFTAPAQPDTARPLLISSSPADSSRSLATLLPVLLQFATEIDSARTPSWRFTGPDTIPAVARWAGPRTLQLSPAWPAVPDALYALRIPAGSLVSWSGVPGPPEERTLVWRGRPEPGRGTLRILVDGPALESPAVYRLMLIGAGSGVPALTVLETFSGGELTTPELPPGPYRLWGYADTDGDGELGIGRVRPFRPSEPVAAITDTLYVRESFESVVPGALYLGPARPAVAAASDTSLIPPP